MMRSPLMPMALSMALLACSCGGDHPSALSPPGPAATPTASVLAPPRRTRHPRSAVPEKPPCERAAELRGRVPALLAQGKLFRTRRALARANKLCPVTASETWAVEVATLTELGALREAQAVAETITKAKDAPAEARKAAEVALAEVARLSRSPGASAKETAKKPYAEAAAAFLRHDRQAAEQAARKAWATYHPNPDALFLAGLAARARGDAAAAQRFFDRARFEAVASDSSCQLDQACEGGAKLLERSLQGEMDEDLLFSPASALIAVNIPSWGVPIMDSGGRTRAFLPRAEYPPHSSAMAFSPDGRRLVRVSRSRSNHSGAAEIYDAETGLLVRQMPDIGGGNGMWPLSLSPDGKRLAGVVVDKHAELWVLDIESGRKVWSKRIVSSPRWMSYTGDGKYVTTVHWEDGPREVELHDARTGRRGPSTKDAEPSSVVLAASPDGAHLAGFFDRRLRVLDVRTGKLTVSFDVEDEGHAVPLSFSPDGKQVMAVRVSDVVIAETATGKVSTTIAPSTSPNFVDSAAFLDDKRVLIKDTGGAFWEWEIGAAAPRRTFGPHDAPHTRAAFSPVDERIATGLRDGDVALWDPGSPTLVQRLSGHTGSVTALAFSRDGTGLFSASRDGTVHRWEVPSGRPLGVLSGHSGPVNALAVSPDDRRVASGSEDGTARLWDTATGAEVLKLAHPTSIRTLAFSQDGKQLLTGSEDGVLRLHDLGTGLVLRSASTGKPVKMAFWAGASEVVSWSAARDTDAHFFRWNAGGGAAEEAQGFSNIVYAAAHSDDGLVMAQASSFSYGSLYESRSGKSLEKLDIGTATIAGMALLDDAEQIAVASSHGLSLFRRGGKEPEITLSVTPGFTAVMAQTPDGYFDIVGPDSDALRRLSRCSINLTHLPIELCEEQFRVPGLFAKVMAGDESFREP